MKDFKNEPLPDNQIEKFKA